MTGQTAGQPSLVERLRDAKDLHNLSNEHLAVALHVNERTVRRWLDGSSLVPGTRGRQIGEYLASLDEKAAA